MRRKKEQSLSADRSAGLNWRAALVLGLISSTYSTISSHLLAGRIGRDAMVDWMVVASIPLRDSALQIEPSAGAVFAGILFHQWADISWAVVFFGLFGRWTAGMKPWTLLAVAPPWALLTWALEWLFLVPLIPFWQPIFTLDQPYWIGFFVHLASASMYPLFPWLRDWMSGHPPSPHRKFGKAWSGLAAAGLAVLGVLALLGSQDRGSRTWAAAGSTARTCAGCWLIMRKALSSPNWRASARPTRISAPLLA